ncbi:MAG TPA: tetratricopeptide repeat protein [Planctomycetaceae bacterium]|nr:tetratricopeptide repeat protein [Planctomycetaceae bacterium]
MILATLEEGLRHHQAGRLDRAEELYRYVLSAEPRQPDALHLLGMAAFVSGRHEEGRDLVCQAIEAKPNEAVFHANLGIVLEALHRWPEAEASYRRALRLNPRNAAALNSLGNLHRAGWRLDEAARCYQGAISLDGRFAAAQSNLGNTFADRNDFDQAIACYRRALEIDPGFVDARKNLANSLAEQGRCDQAAEELRRAQTLRPDDAALKIRSALLLPAIVESSTWIDERRRKLSDDLDDLLRADLHVTDPIGQTLGPAFYLAYHGRNDVDLQRKIAAMYSRAVPSLAFTAPHCRGTKRSPQPQIRVGLISRFFHNHSVGDHYAGLVRSFPRVQTTYTVFRFPGADDAVSRGIEDAADDVVLLSPRIAEAREQIAGRELDVLLYTDIGMDPWTYFLAFARLARVQCVTLGHPVTTGIPTIDYFLSCDQQEPVDAAAHYTERLIRFANKPHYFSQPRLTGPELSRGDFPLPADARWYVCHQTLFKIHPDFDQLVGEILWRDPRGIVVLFEGQQAHWTRLLQDRLQASIPDVFARVVFLPRLSYDEYLAFLRLADVLLDTVHFGAGTTTYHALALGVPLVTLPGAYSRGRGTDAAYRRLGVSQCVAADPNDYVRRALAIANDRSLRDAIGAAFRERVGMLFANVAGAREIEAFFVDAARRAEAGPT